MGRKKDDESDSLTTSEKEQRAPSAGRLVALSDDEVGAIALELQGLLGAQLQECLQTPSELGLAFYLKGQLVWLWFDLEPLHPLVVRFYGRPPARKKLSRPLTLFLRSRFFGRRLASVMTDERQGRVLKLAFHRGNDEEEQGVCEIEVRLFPHGQNVIARDGEKSISESKPKDLASGGAKVDARPPRPWEEIEGQWRAREFKKTARPPESVAARTSGGELSAAERAWKKAVEKKQRALELLQLEIEEKSSNRYAEVGEWLKSQTSLDDWRSVPAEWRDLLDPKLGLSGNIERAFQKAKDNARKISGTRARRQAVEEELAKLKSAGPNSFVARSSSEVSNKNDLLVRTEARGRRFKVAEDLEVYVGKSAADNLALLRGAQPFDYWLHLREQASSHAILRRTRQRQVTDVEFVAAARWVVEQTLKKRAADLKGQRFDILIVECRYVRPIKGDRLGRVHYTHDRCITLRF